MAKRQPLAIGVALAVLSLTLAIALAGARAQRAQAASSSSAPAFGQPTISGIQGVGFEQDLRLDPANPNRLYTSVPGSLSSDTSWIWHSTDAGKTFKWVTAALSATAVKDGKPNSCAGGGDTELAVDTGGNLYFNDLTLANFSTARSTDQGATFVCSNAGVPDSAVDRQWYAVDGNPTTGTGLGNGEGHNIFLANDEIGPGAPQCPVSGLINNELVMYRSPLPPPLFGGATAGIQFGPGYKITQPLLLNCDEGIMGNNEVSPVRSSTGKLDASNNPTTLAAPVKHVYVIHDDASFSKILIGRCFPVDFGAPIPNVSDPSGLNCDDLKVADLGSPASVKTGGNFPAMAIDKAGNLYAVWEQAPVTGGKIGNSSLMYSFSTDEGNHWSTPITIPTPNLLNNVFAWPAAGADGRVDIAFYGTSAAVNTTTGGPQGCTNGGPDSVNGTWSLYLVQTLNGHSAPPTFTAPVLAGEHYIHKGSIQTVMGGQCGDRTLGDFLQLRVGSRGEAQISYADSNNADAPFAPHGMYVKQNGGASVLSSSPQVSGDPILLNAANDPSGDGTRDTNGVSSPNMANLDILHSSMSQPAPANCHPAGTPCYRVRMTINNLALTPPAPDTADIWLTQWLVPADPGCTSTSDSCKKGGKNPFVYFEFSPTSLTAPATCWSGENAAQLIGGGAALTYPGTNQITAPGACSVVTGPFGSITIDVPIADVSLASGVAPLSNRLYSVTASTMTLPAGDAEHPKPDKGLHTAIGGVSVFNSPIGGQLFDLIDVVRAYDFVLGAEGGGGGGGGGGGVCHEGDGNGDIHGEFSGTASFNVDADHCEENDTDNVQVKDDSAGVDFHSTQILSVAFDDVAQTMTIVGVGVDHGLPVTFTAVETDGLVPAARTVEIDLSDGYSNISELVDGSITLQ